MKKNFMIIMGSIILATGLYFFLIQHDIAAGGISGLALVISKIVNIDVGILNLIFNTIVLIMGAILVSFKFAKRSLLSASIVSGFIILFETFFPDSIITNDMILNIVIGAITISLGLGLIFYNEGSSGGTDVIATILNKKTHLPIPATLFMTDFFVITLSASIIGIERSLYAVLAIIISSLGLDYFIQGFGRKIAVFVISDNYEIIRDSLVSKHKRGVTLLEAEGGYSGNEKKIILTISNIRRYPTIREDILSIDDRAFIFTHTISEVYGEGFTFDQLN